MMSMKEAARQKRTEDWLTEQALIRLEEVVTDGLDPAYGNSAESFMWDFYPDLSWDEEAGNREIRSILDNPRFAPVDDYFQEKLNFNLKAQLEFSLELKE